MSPGSIPLLAVVGPTASGKSQAAIELARRFDGEVVAADSMQVYRYMNIGTAKPSLRERALVPHHLVDVRFPDEDFSVADYQRLARQAVGDIAGRGRLPILAGGSGLYVRAVVDAYQFYALETDNALRAALHAEARRHGAATLHRRLAACDPAAAARIHPNDLRRVVRALEVYTRTGVPISELQGRPPRSPYNLIMAGIATDRRELYQRIDGRVDAMAAAGLAEEVRGLLQRGYGPKLRSMQALGYRELALHWAGELTLAAALDLIKLNTRHFARRQMTWFSRDPRIAWISAAHYGSPEYIVPEIARRLKGKWSRE